MDLPFFLQNTDTQDGYGFAAQATDIEAGEATFMEKEITLTEEAHVGFWWKVDSEIGNTFRFYVDGTETAAIEGTSGAWQFFVVNDMAAGTHTLRWEYSKTVADTGTLDTAWVDKFRIGHTYEDIVFSLPTGTTAPLPSEYSTSAAHAFFLQNAVTKDLEGFSAQTGSIAVGETTYMERVITLNKTNPVSFWWKVDSEAENELMFYVDGELESTVSGQGADWQFISKDL